MPSPLPGANVLRRHIKVNLKRDSTDGDGESCHRLITLRPLTSRREFSEPKKLSELPRFEDTLVAKRCEYESVKHATHARIWRFGSVHDRTHAYLRTNVRIIKIRKKLHDPPGLSPAPAKPAPVKESGIWVERGVRSTAPSICAEILIPVEDLTKRLYFFVVPTSRHARSVLSIAR